MATCHRQKVVSLHLQRQAQRQTIQTLRLLWSLCQSVTLSKIEEISDEYRILLTDAEGREAHTQLDQHSHTSSSKCVSDFQSAAATNVGSVYLSQVRK